MTFRPETADPMAINAAGRICPDVEHLLGPGGPIAEGMPGWQDRPQQRHLSQTIRRAFKQRRNAITEGQTGVGKTHALLIPAILHALETGKPVVISTHTIALQAQYCERDIPQLQALISPWLEARFGRSFTFAKQLGRANYYCETKSPDDPHFAGELATIQDWRETTEDGDLGGLSFELPPRLRQLVTAGKDECAGARCPHAKDGSCWFYAAKRKVRESDLIVVNHALLLAAIRALPGTVLPLFDALVIDEAHHLEAEATKSLGVEVGPARVSRLAAKALQFCGENRQGMLGLDEPAEPCECCDHLTMDCLCPCHNAEPQECPNCETHRHEVGGCHPLCEWEPNTERTTGHSPSQEAVDTELRQLFQALTHEHRAGGNQGEALLRDLTHTAAVDHLDEICAHLRRLAVDVENVGEQHWEESTERAKADTLSGSLRDLAGELSGLRSPRPGRVAWIQMGDKPALHAAPVDVADYLQDTLWKTPSALSSATLATGTGEHAFTFAQESLGLRTMHQIQVGSPFKWDEQALLYLPEEGNLERNLGLGVTSPQKREECAREYARVQALHLLECLNLTKGRGLLLFTSQKGMEHTRDALLTKGMKWPHIVQGEMTKQEAIAWFRETKGVLFGLASLWEGVDIQGDALSLLYQDRLPLPPPTDLLWQARLERAGGGHGAFQRLSVPYAITRVKQGFGRLIRAATDRGICILGDPRLQTKAYGATILAALPPARRIQRGQLRHLPFFLAQAGVPHERPDLVGAVMALDPARMTPEHAGWWKRIGERAPLLPSGLWRVGEWLCKKYSQNDSKTILKGE